jgi:chromate transporter
MIYLLLFWEFFKTGLFSVGGGLATLPFLYDMAARYSGFTTEELANMIAISESTPGPIGINMATYAGVNAAGVLGGIVATFSLVLPSVIIIMLIAGLLTRFRENRFVQSSMSVLRPLSVGLVGAACFSVVKVTLLNWDAVKALDWANMIALWPLLLFAVLFVVRLVWKKVHPLVLILLGAAAGILLQL